MRDLRKDLSNLFDKYAHNIIFIRRDLRFHCECYVERSGESKADCPRCFGTGHQVRIEKHRTRRVINAIPETLSGAQASSGLGKITPKAYKYYLEHFVEPKDGDMILEVEWVNQMPARIIQKNLISVAEPKQGFEGRVEFYQVYCKYDPKGVNDDEALT